MMHPAKPFTRDHAAVIVNASVFVVDNPAIAAIEISIVLVVFISVLIFTDQFSFFEIISPVIKYQNEFQLRSYHYICTYSTHKNSREARGLYWSDPLLSWMLRILANSILALHLVLNKQKVLFCSNQIKNTREDIKNII